MTTTRAHRRWAGVVLGALVALAACGSDDSGSAASSTAVDTTTTVDTTTVDTTAAIDTTTTTATTAPDTGDALVPPAEGVTQYPLTLTSWAGDTVLEERPERIAVIGFSPNMDALEALGVTPVYAQSEEAEWPWRDPAWLAGIEFLDTATRRDPTNFEAIAAADPDLIVAVNFIYDQADFELLRQIAPVLENAEEIDGDKIEWQATQRMVGEALDLSGAAEELIAAAEQAIVDTAEAHPEFADRTITVATDYVTSGLQYYSVQGGTVEGVMTMLGFTPNPLAANFTTEAVVSEERLDLLDGDVLLVFYVDGEARQAREATPLFSALAPVAEGRYIGVDDTDPGINAAWVMRRGASAISLPWTVDVIADWVSALDAAS